MSRAKQALNKKGVTLIELIVSIFVFSIIMVTAVSIFAPMLRTHAIANDYAEANTLLDNIANLVLHEIDNAVGEIDPPSGTLPGGSLGFRASELSQFIFLEIHNNILTWNTEQNEPLTARPMLDRGFYGGKDLSIEWDFSDGLFILTITLHSNIEGLNEWSATRTYSSRPVGLRPKI
jgi:prepilin-type N-terminal cleavage/methylation domain-containing protein